MPHSFLGLLPRVLRSKYDRSITLCLIFRTDIKRTKEYLLYTDVKLLGDVVNYIGLIIGICLLNLADVFGGVLDKYMR